MSVCVCRQKILKNASSRAARTARAFEDVILNEKKKQQNHTGTFLYLTQVKAVLFAVILATSYYWFLGSTPFEIAQDLQSATMCMP